MGQPHPQWTDRPVILVFEGMHPASLLDDPLALSLDGRLVVLGEIDELPAFSVNFLVNIVLCRARMALESPTLAQITSSLVIHTPTKVEPLQDTLISESVSPFCSFSNTLGRHCVRSPLLFHYVSTCFVTFLARY